LPHAAVELALKLTLGKPATFIKPVAAVPDPLTCIVEPMLLLAVQVAVIATDLV
jgi:hypothetical protein